MNNIDEILIHFNKVRQTSQNQWMVRCPAHHDRTPSLSIKHDFYSGRVLMHCFAGCDFKSILQSAGLEPKDLHLNKYKHNLIRAIGVAVA